MYPDLPSVSETKQALRFYRPCRTLMMLIHSCRRQTLSLYITCQGSFSVTVAMPMNFRLVRP
jgi:hypothetical protein